MEIEGSDDSMNAIEKAFGNPFGTVADIVLIALFLIATTLLNAYAVSKLNNLIRAVLGTRCFTRPPIPGGYIESGQEPMVTIQICCYNEGNVIEDTINAACTVDWPRDKLCVQVLDDSNDETIMIAEAVCRKWRERGMNCHRLTRPDRVGYKAGNLHYHTSSIQGEYVAMLDADHRCENQFLRRCIPHFFDSDGQAKERVGLVQCPWAYYNAHSNLLTEYDALNLDMSFVIEQTARHWALGVFGFNGTGGIWRKQAIEAGGGWSWETITEDLDLSYEAYLAGYEFVFVRDLPQQLEVPAGIRAHVQQKFRWTKGYWQVTRKTLRRLVCDSHAPFRVKLEAFFQYTGSLAYALTLFLVLFAPILAYRNLFSPVLMSYTVAPSFVALMGAVCTVFGKDSGSNGSYKTFLQRFARLRFVPLLFAFALGMMVFETYAIYEGLTSDDATFVRTPKEGTPIDGDQRLEYDEDDEETRPGIVTMTLEKDVEMGCHGDDERSVKTVDSKDSSKKEQAGNIVAPVKPVSQAKNNRRQPKSCPCNLPTLTPKGRKFQTNLLNGLAGLAVAAYLCGWCVWLYLLKRQDPNGGLSFLDYFLVFLLPLPCAGLLYIHGTFVYQLLASKLRKRKKQKKRGKENEKSKTEARTISIFHRLYFRVFPSGTKQKDPAGTGDTVSTDSCSQMVPPPPQLLRCQTADTALTYDMSVSEVFYSSSGRIEAASKSDLMYSESSGNSSSFWSMDGAIACNDSNEHLSPCSPIDELENPSPLPDHKSVHISATMPDFTSHHSPLGRRTSLMSIRSRLDSFRSLNSSFRSFAWDEDEHSQAPSHPPHPEHPPFADLEAPPAMQQGQRYPLTTFSTDDPPCGGSLVRSTINVATEEYQEISRSHSAKPLFQQRGPVRHWSTGSQKDLTHLPQQQKPPPRHWSTESPSNQSSFPQEHPPQRQWSTGPQTRSRGGNTASSTHQPAQGHLSIRSINPTFGGSTTYQESAGSHTAKPSCQQKAPMRHWSPGSQKDHKHLPQNQHQPPPRHWSTGSPRNHSQFSYEHQPKRHWSTGSERKSLRGTTTSTTKRLWIRSINPAFGGPTTTRGGVAGVESLKETTFQDHDQNHEIFQPHHAPTTLGSKGSDTRRHGLSAFRPLRLPTRSFQNDPAFGGSSPSSLQSIDSYGTGQEGHSNRFEKKESGPKEYLSRISSNKKSRSSSRHKSYFPHHTKGAGPLGHCLEQEEMECRRRKIPFLVQEQREIDAAICIQACIRSAHARMRVLKLVEDMIVSLQMMQDEKTQREDDRGRHDGPHTMMVSWDGRPRQMVELTSASLPHQHPSVEERQEKETEPRLVAAAITIQAFVRSVLARVRVRVVVERLIAQVLDADILAETMGCPAHSRHRIAIGGHSN